MKVRLYFDGMSITMGTNRRTCHKFDVDVIWMGGFPRMLSQIEDYFLLLPPPPSSSRKEENSSPFLERGGGNHLFCSLSFS